MAITTSLGICNLALSNIGISQISSLSDTDKVSVECNLRYEPARDAVLREHDWGFARVREDLVTTASLGTSISIDGWDYVYQYPEKCLAARKIYNSAGSPVLEFETRYDSASDTRIIVSNEEDAQLEYTYQHTNVELYDPMFISALAWRLAAELALPLRAVPELQQLCFNSYRYTLGYAKALDGNEVGKNPSADDDNPYLSARD